MPRRRVRVKEDDEDEDIDVINVESRESPVAKKHKKHKKKHGSDGSRKHGGRHRTPKDQSSPAPENVKPPIKLKIRIGNETFGNSHSEQPSSTQEHKEASFHNVSRSHNQNEAEDEAVDVVADEPSTPLLDDYEEEEVVEEEVVEDEQDDDEAVQPELAEDEDEDDDDDADDSKRTSSARRSDDSTSEDEKQWLDALESGNLEDYERKKHEKDPALLTARQRALLGGVADMALMELPSGYKTTEMTEEQQQRRKQRALKRRIQAQEKKEKAKKQTLDRLLKKQQETSKRSKKKGTKIVQKPYIRYINGINSCSISVPIGIDTPFTALPPKLPPKPIQMCGVKGCGNPKKYSCSKTGVPLCSLQCYKKNLETRSFSSTVPATFRM